LLQYLHYAGCRGVLARRATKLFNFVADALKTPGKLLNSTHAIELAGIAYILSNEGILEIILLRGLGSNVNLQHV
jgi:hypothetical protein